MKVNVVLPFDHIENPEEFLQPQAVAAIATLLERLGYNGGEATDHPCPTGRWLDAGGHYAQDPFVMLAFVAAATTRFRLQTGVLVLPYRNPFVTARAVATLDVYSAGRVTLGLGAGYMKGEYRAVGADFEQRNEIMDEYLLAMKAAWTGEDFTFKGTGYEALGNRVRPAPIQKPHPPLLVGGNSRRAIRRAVELGDGWYPFYSVPQVSATSRTAKISNTTDLADSLVYLREHCEKIGREQLPDVVLGNLLAPDQQLAPAAIIDEIGQLSDMGVGGVSVQFAGRTRIEWCDNAERFATEVLANISAA